MLAAGLGALVVAPAVVDPEAKEGEVGSGVAFGRVGAGLTPGSAPVWAVGIWTVGPCVDTLSAWGLGGAGLAVERPGVCPGLSVLRGVLALAKVKAVV